MSLNIIGYLVYFLWPLFVGHALQEFVPRKVILNDTFFLINGFIFILTSLTILIISDGEGMTFSGLEALPFFYVVFAFVHYLSFPGKTLRSIEHNREASFGEYFGDFFLVVFLPFGIWFLQPRINKIVSEHTLEDEIKN
ncbi:MAG TPA: hypothetical protein VGQ59_02025, partial [Cyclobacteriaceae bacterium]|jgi:hypothetical protein|nr:hypothetical protein [Cyclobacteriaceae bacterium]